MAEVLLRNKKWRLLLFTGILVIAIFVRLWQIQAIPPGLYSDEAVNGMDVIHSLETGDFRVFYPANNGREGLYMWLLALIFKFFGIGLLQFRLLSPVVGIATVASIYFLAKEAFGEKRERYLIALVSMFFIATSFWHINFSRIGFRAILMPLILSWTLVFLLRALKNKRVVNFAASGVIFGIGLYTYTGFRMALLIIPTIFALTFTQYCIRKKSLPFFRWKDFKTFLVAEGWWKWGVLCTALLIVAFPLLLYFIQNPVDVSSRAEGVFVFSREHPIREFLASTVKTLGMFNIKGDMNWRHNDAGTPQLFFPVGILFVTGLFIMMRESAVSISRFVKKGTDIPPLHASYFLILVSFVIMLLPATLTWEGIPHALRTLGVIPLVYLAAGIGFSWLCTSIENIYRRRDIPKITLFIFLAVFFTGIAVLELDKYLTWGSKPEVRDAFSKKLVDIAAYLNGTYPGSPANEGFTRYVVDEDGPWESGGSIAIQTIRFLTYVKGEAHYLSFNDLEQTNIDEDERVLIIPLRDEETIYRLIFKRYGEQLEEKVYNKFIVLTIGR